MSGFNLFWDFTKTSTNEVWQNKKKYLPSFLALVLLGNMESLYTVLGGSEESNAFIFTSLFSTLLTFVVLSKVILDLKKEQGGSGELKYFIPTFLLYNLYYSFIFFGGLLFLILPGLYFLVMFSMAPFVAVLDDEADGGYFKKSRELVKKNISLVVWTSLVTLILEFTALLFTPIHDPIIKMVAGFCFSLPDAFVTLVVTIATVKIYYYLKKI